VDAVAIVALIVVVALIMSSVAATLLLRHRDRARERNTSAESD
jgi:hypothetical protein